MSVNDGDYILVGKNQRNSKILGNARVRRKIKQEKRSNKGR